MYNTLFTAFDDLKNKSYEFYNNNLKNNIDAKTNDISTGELQDDDFKSKSCEDKDMKMNLFNLDWKIDDMINAANKASQILKSTLVETANAVKTNLEGNVNIVSDFQKVQEKFQTEVIEPNNHMSSSIWQGHENEENFKKQILSLSQDMRNFLRSPPDGSEFAFDFSTYATSAKEMLILDPRLRAMRFQLVPKKIKEEFFWRNYFYRVSLIKQSINLYDNIVPKESNPKDGKLSTASAQSQGPEKNIDDRVNQPGLTDDEETLTQTEFISDTIVKEEEGYLSSTSGEKLNLDEELEKMLGDDLKEYELVKKSTSESNQSPHGSSFNDDPEWDKELQEMLDNQKT